MYITFMGVIQIKMNDNTVYMLKSQYKKIFTLTRYVKKQVCSSVFLENKKYPCDFILPLV
jgi:hypothetical protein